MGANLYVVQEPKDKSVLYQCFLICYEAIWVKRSVKLTNFNSFKSTSISASRRISSNNNEETDTIRKLKRETPAEIISSISAAHVNESNLNKEYLKDGSSDHSIQSNVISNNQLDSEIKSSNIFISPVKGFSDSYSSLASISSPLCDTWKQVQTPKASTRSIDSNDSEHQNVRANLNSSRFPTNSTNHSFKDAITVITNERKKQKLKSIHVLDKSKIKFGGSFADSEVESVKAVIRLFPFLFVMVIIFVYSCSQNILTLMM